MPDAVLSMGQALPHSKGIVFEVVSVIIFNSSLMYKQLHIFDVWNLMNLGIYKHS